MIYYFHCFLRVQFYCIQIARQLEYGQVTLVLLANLHLVIQHLEKIPMHSLCLCCNTKLKGNVVYVIFFHYLLLLVLPSSI